MAEAFEGTWPQDRNVSRQNLRHEKRLKKQLAVLEKERNWRSKSLAADKRCFEEKVHRLNMKPTDRAHLAKDTNDMVVGDKKKELDRLLKSLLHRPYETRAGYSYIEYLSRNMQPLVKRPLQWGVNPPLSSPRTRLSVDASQPRADRKPTMFLTRIEGQTVSLNERIALPIKRPEKFKPRQLVLPPITPKQKSQVLRQHSEIITEIKNPSRDEKNKDIPKVESQTKTRKKSREMDTKKPNAQEKVPEKMNDSDRNVPPPSRDSKVESTESVPKEKDVFVTMVRLDVPTPNYYHLEAPVTPDEEPYDEARDRISTPELESHSQGYYTITIGPRDRRRKSI